MQGPLGTLFATVARAEEAQRLRVPEQPIEADETDTAIGAYERLRYLLDYREDHTIRRNAIERILKRHIFIERRSDPGATLPQELAAGSYITHEQATEELAQESRELVAEFLNLASAARASDAATRRLVSFAATEIESRLSPVEHTIDQAAVEAFYETLRSRVASPLPATDANAFLYCASWRALLAVDDERLAYALWLLYAPQWRGEAKGTIANDLTGILTRIRTLVKHEAQWQIVPKIRREALYFRVIRELMLEQGSAAASLLENDRDLERDVRPMLTRIYADERMRIRSAGVRAVVYLFITKMVVALLVEVPYELLRIGEIAYLPLFVNIFFHPILLFALTRGAGLLDERNTDAVLAGIRTLVRGQGGSKIRLGARYSRFALAFDVLYTTLFFVVFGVLIAFLELIGFNSVSTTLFVLFFALVSYFAFRIQQHARRWRVDGTRGSAATIATMFTIPIVRIGGWLSRTFASINIFVIVMDALIETPFKRILNFISEFMHFAREKIEEMR